MIRPILPISSVNHILPSGPAAIPIGPLGAVGRGNSVMTPAVVMRPMAFASSSVNQRLPVGPIAMNAGRLGRVGVTNSVIMPPAVRRPMRSASNSVNQMFPKGPVVIPRGLLFAVGIGNSVSFRNPTSAADDGPAVANSTARMQRNRARCAAPPFIATSVSRKRQGVVVRESLEP